MATYKKNEIDLVNIYIVEIDYYLDETVFNGEYLKNEDRQLVYFGLQNVDGDYLNKLSNEDLTNCITSDDDNYTIKLEKVDNTGAKIFINKPKKKLTLDKRYKVCSFYFIDILQKKHRFLQLTYKPKKICSYTNVFSIQPLIQISTPTFSFNQLYSVINYNGTGGVIDITELKKASSYDIKSQDLDNKILCAYGKDKDNNTCNVPPNINLLTYTYYSFYVLSDQSWFYNESGYTPIDFLSIGYDKIYNIKNMSIFDYSQNKISYKGFNGSNDNLLYFCAINESKVIPIFKIVTFYSDRSKMNQNETYTTYIIK